jgi:membrane fusion protein (multidrug efflux system)
MSVSITPARGIAVAVLALLAPALHAAGAAPGLAKPAGVGAALEAREIRAQLSPRRFTTLAAEIGAKVSRVPLPEGAPFRQGQILVRFDCTLQQTQLAKAEATVMAADTTWQANSKLIELKSVGKVELDTSKAELLKAKAELAANRAIAGKCQVLAPFSGRIAEQKVREQQYAQPGQPLLEIIDDSTLELEFIVPSKWLAWARQGVGFKVTIDETGKTYPAKVQRVGARVDPVSQSVKLTAVIDGRFSELVAGMSGRVLMAPPASSGL